MAGVLTKLILMFGSEVFLLASLATAADKVGNTSVVYEWVKLNFLWPNDTIKNTFIRQGKFVPENCILSGLEVFENKFYVTVPRLRNGVPSSLNVIKLQDNKPFLMPYPSLEKNMDGADKCDNFQFVSSIAIDRRTGWMWIIDTGRVNLLPFDGTSPINFCPAKIVIFNVRNSTQVRSHIFSEKVVSKTSNYLRDIVIDGKMAYISDTFDNKLIVYNYETDTSFSVRDSTMMPDAVVRSFRVGRIDLNWRRGINGIALSKDSKTLYYSPFSSYSIYGVPTSVIKTNITAFKDSVYKAGNMTSVSNSMVCSHNHLYVSLLSLDAIYYWDIRQLSKATENARNNTMQSFKMLTKNAESMQWPESMTIDGHYLWFITNRMQKFFTLMDFTGNDGMNFRILKTYIGKQSSGGETLEKMSFLMVSLASVFVIIVTHFH